MTISALTTDLMDRSKFPPGAAFVRQADKLDGAADIVAVDLSHPESVAAVLRLRAEGSAAHIVAYGRHTEVDRLAEARAAGCDEVLARSEFFADVAAALGTTGRG